MTLNPTNLVSGTLSNKAQANVLNSIEAIRKALPFLISLSKEERQRLAKPGTEALVACETITRTLDSHSKLFTSDIVDLNELKRDLALIQDLTPIQETLSRLLDDINSTLLAAKSDSYRAGLQAYTLATMKSEQHSGLAAAIEPLKNVLGRLGRARKEKETK